jgi:hypothetical protein
VAVAAAVTAGGNLAGAAVAVVGDPRFWSQFYKPVTTVVILGQTRFGSGFFVQKIMYVGGNGNFPRKKKSFEKWVSLEISRSIP